MFGTTVSECFPQFGTIAVWDQLFGTMDVWDYCVDPGTVWTIDHVQLFGTMVWGGCGRLVKPAVAWDPLFGTMFGTMGVRDPPFRLGPTFTMGVWDPQFRIMRVWDHGPQTPIIPNDGAKPWSQTRVLNETNTHGPKQVVPNDGLPNGMVPNSCPWSQTAGPPT